MSATQYYHTIFGGSWQENNLVIQYDISQNQFQKLQINTNLKINNWSNATQISNEEFIISGGLGNTGKIISNEAFTYNASNQSISQFPSFTQCRYVHQSIFHHNKLYLIGGRQYGPDFESVLSHCEMYEEGQWKVISSMSKRRSNFGVFIYNDKIHVIGGFDGKKNTKSIEYYDEQKNIWIRHKAKTHRGLAGFQVLPKGPHKILLIGGMTIQGLTTACTLLDLKNNCCLADSSFQTIRSLFHIANNGNNYFIYGGMNKQNAFELYLQDTNEWEFCQVGVPEELYEIFDSGLRGFTSTSQKCIISNQDQIEQKEQFEIDPEEVSFLLGNDEFPFILPIHKNMTEQFDPLWLPTNLNLYSYMSVCSVDAELPNCRQIFVAGGIDQKISSINKKAYLITIIFPEMKLKIKKIDKLKYHRYAAVCVYLYPYVYIIGGRGYQNDLLSLHSTVETYHVDDNEWGQVSPLNEAKCSMAASVVDDKIYVVGGYIGEGQMSHKIECFNEQTQVWDMLNVELPFSLEGLSSIVLGHQDMLIIGGKGIDGSKKDVVRFNYQELEQNHNTSGQVIGQLKYSRSLPKPLVLGENKILILGGYFYDNPDTNFGEMYCPLNPEEESQEFVNIVEMTIKSLGANEQINMFSVAE